VKAFGKMALMLFLSALIPLVCGAQCPTNANPCSQGVPHFVKFSGVLKNAAGLPRPNTVTIRFVIYGDSTGGTPLWQEVQNTLLDSQGRYEVMLGATGNDGIPVDLFTSGEPRWLEVQALQPGEEAQPRVMLVSEPYALEAADAQTLGGLPASAFARVAPNNAAFLNAQASNAAPVNSAALAVAGTNMIGNTSPAASVPSAVTTPGGTPGTLPKFSTATSIVSSQITENNGVVSVENLANVLFADRFAGGVPDAVAACPANGCIIYAISPNVNLNLGTIDPGYKAITIYLGPFTYTVKQITLRKGLKIIGMGASGGVNGSVTCSVAAPCNGTALQSVNGNNPVFVIPQANNQPATNLHLSGFRVLGSVGNTSEDGFFLDASSTRNSGLWYSVFEDINVEGFSGVAIHLRARANDFLSSHQWLLFRNVTVLRNSGGGNALRLEGSVFELHFTNCQFDGQSIGDGTNIYIGGIPGGGLSGFPVGIVFQGMVSQSAGTAVQLDGGINIRFNGSHHEQLWGGYLITNNNNIGTRGVTISESYFAGNVGANGGTGYDVSIPTTGAQGIVFAHNQVFGNPDAIVRGMDFASVIYQDNLCCETFNGPATSGITGQQSPAATINIRGVHSMGLNPSSTPITTIQSALGPGEMVTFFTLGGPVTFGAGGNIDLMGMSTLTLTGTITFVRSDLGGSLWKPVSQWAAPASPPSPTAQAQKSDALHPQAHLVSR
jgi:hypothetical protein